MENFYFLRSNTNINTKFKGKNFFLHAKVLLESKAQGFEARRGGEGGLKLVGFIIYDMCERIYDRPKDINSFHIFYCFCFDLLLWSYLNLFCNYLFMFKFMRQSIFVLVSLFRSSRPEVFCKKVFLKNIIKFTGKYLCQSLSPGTLLKRKLWHRCFPAFILKVAASSNER